MRAKMHPLLLALVGFFVLSSSVRLTLSKERHGSANAFQIFELFSYAIAIFDEDQDGDLDCVRAKRMQFDKDAPSATYIWLIQGDSPKSTILFQRRSILMYVVQGLVVSSFGVTITANMRNITFHIKPGPTPDSSSYTMDEDYEHEYNANFFFSDYENCVIHDFPHKDKIECMMWVSIEAVDNIPQICTDQYLENCDMQMIVYDKDSCGQFMDA